MKKWLIGIGAAALVSALCIPMFFGPSDQKLIKEALQESVKASREGRPGGVMDYLSSSLKVNEEDVENRGEIGRYIKNARPEVVIENPTPVITGDTATVVSPVTVTFSIGPVSQPARIERVVITLAKETGTRFLIFPAPKWRIKEITTSVTDLSQFAQ